MKNKIKFFLLSIFILVLSSKNVLSTEDFNFNISEIEILNDGNLFKGLKRGTATTNHRTTTVRSTDHY